MRAIRLHAFGPAANLTYEEVKDPEPGPGEVRIKVAVAGVHLVDTAIRSGEFSGPFPLPELPTIPGREVAGTVDALGEGVEASRLGSRVVAHLGQAPGGYAELAVVGAEKLHALPNSLPEDRAVAMIGTGRTTVGILRFVPDLGPEDVVVVTAAAGGIGSLLVQYAKHVGATVVGAAGGPVKIAAVRELGADIAVDYKQPDWPHQVRSLLSARGATVVFDGVGGELARKAVELLGPGGQHIVHGWSSGITGGGPLELSEEELAARGITSQPVLGPAMLAKAGGGPQAMRALEAESLSLAAAGTLVPMVQRFPLAEAARAHQALETRATMGKVVLVP